PAPFGARDPRSRFRGLRVARDGGRFRRPAPASPPPDDPFGRRGPAVLLPRRSRTGIGPRGHPETRGLVLPATRGVPPGEFPAGLIPGSRFQIPDSRSSLRAEPRLPPAASRLVCARLFSMPLKLTTAGESHGPRLTAILEGIPAGLAVDAGFVNAELARRQHGYGRGARMKIEKDEALFEGGVRGGVTLGSPIGIGIVNRDHANWEKVM